ncbi:hypothetical protein L0B53_15575 [Vibrio sp. SS-MA-C1-2]|uniref:hypothetical protein n=1 Tax=Vibrio sp. SS-MA-C1-2 TaxID=2908646 RepID=UPI001F3714AC|nr:hypothetical protein [Vibrio sp. SS-MA-C1-2]UJF18426.1 hypothetical protein L0B53_15575 [Vibrio sp. SS-MA-C1-2]
MDNLIKTLTKSAVFISLYIAQVALFWTAFEKFSGAPQWLTDMLGNSPLASMTSLGWFIIGILELLVLVLIIISIIKLEFIGENNAIYIKAAISVGMVALAVMAMGTSFANDFSSKASFIYYLGAQAILYIIANKESQR